MSDMLESSWPDALADEAFVLMSPRRSSDDDPDSEEEGFGDELGEGLDDEFDAVFNSSELGLAKPDP